MNKKLLLTGFEAFHTHSQNPSEQIVKRLDGQIINNFEIQGLVLPVEYERAPKILIENLLRLEPSCAISLGLANKRAMITPELVALNYQHASIADNINSLKNFELIDKNSPVAYFSTLPLEKMLAHLQKNQFDVELSSTAGMYVCNRVFYTLMHTLALKDWKIPAGFIHVPATSDVDKLVDAISCCIESLNEFQHI